MFLKSWPLIFVLCACGSAKNYHDEVRDESFLRIPKRQSPQAAKEILLLKTEELNLTEETQPPQENHLLQLRGAQKFLALQKIFLFPIQFKGWISLAQVKENLQGCALAEGPRTQFILIDDHGGRLLLLAGERYRVIIEKLYAIRGEFENTENCQSVDVEFAVSFGVNE